CYTDHNESRTEEDAMPISVTATEVARNFNGVMEKARAAGSVTVIKNSHPIAQIIPIDEVKEEQDMVKLAEDFMDEYDDMFVELAK
ncbi:type II toxin-antitoxin system Phd/YefM family antitoxin, partial [Gordonibacter pamelaeae]